MEDSKVTVIKNDEIGFLLLSAIEALKEENDNLRLASYQLRTWGEPEAFMVRFKCNFNHGHTMLKKTGSRP